MKKKKYLDRKMVRQKKHYQKIKEICNSETHKISNPTRVISSSFNKTIENLSIFVENIFYGISSELPSRIKDTNHMLDITL